MNMQKKQLKKMTGACCLAVAMGLALNAAAAPTITDVKAQQRYPWNGKFDISYTATGVDEECRAERLSASLLVYAVERTTHVTNVAKAAYLSGDMVMTNGTHKFVWDMDAQGIFQGVVSTNFEVFVSAEVTAGGGVQLWKDGPYWDECNVGATKPEEFGYHFWWGGTVGYKRNANDDGWVSVEDGTAFEFKEANCPTLGKDVAALTSAGYVDASGNLVAAHDAATVHLGALWRMPTYDEVSALVTNCTYTWITRNDVGGWLMTGKGDYETKSIFLPAAGFGNGSVHSRVGYDVWLLTSTPVLGYDSECAYAFSGLHESYGRTWVQCRKIGRDGGHAVRAVRTSAQ